PMATQALVEFIINLPSSVNPYEATAEKIKQETQSAVPVLWGRILRRIVAFNFLVSVSLLLFMINHTPFQLACLLSSASPADLVELFFVSSLCIQTITVLRLRKKANKLHFFRCNKLGLIHVELLNETVLLLFLFSLLGLVDLVTQEWVDKGLLRFSSKIVLQICIETAMNVTSLGARERAGASIRLSPFIRFALNGLLLAFMLTPGGVYDFMSLFFADQHKILLICFGPLTCKPHSLVLLFWLSIQGAGALRAIEDTSGKIVAALLQAAPTYRPENYNHLSVIQIVKPLETIFPHVTRFAYDTKFILYLYLVQHILIAVVYLPIFITVLRSLRRQISPKYVSEKGFAGNPTAKERNAIDKLSAPSSSASHFSDPTWVFVEQVAGHGPSVVISNVILAFLIQNVLYSNKKRLNCATVPVNIHPDSVLEGGKSHKARWSNLLTIYPYQSIRMRRRLKKSNRKPKSVLTTYDWFEHSWNCFYYQSAVPVLWGLILRRITAFSFFMSVISLLVVISDTRFHVACFLILPQLNESSSFLFPALPWTNEMNHGISKATSDEKQLNSSSALKTVGLIHVELLNETIQWHIFFLLVLSDDSFAYISSFSLLRGLVGLVDLVTQEWVDKGLLRFSSKMVLQVCKFPIADVVSCLFVDPRYRNGNECHNFGCRERDGASIRLSPFLRFALNGTLVAFMLTPVGVYDLMSLSLGGPEQDLRTCHQLICFGPLTCKPHPLALLLWHSIRASNSLRAIEHISGNIMAALLQAAPTYRPENYSPLSVFQIVKPLETIFPYIKRFAYDAKFILYLSLVHHILIAVVYLPIFITVLRSLRRQSSTRDQRVFPGNHTATNRDEIDKVRKRLIKHACLIYLQEILYCPALIYMVSAHSSGASQFSDPTWVFVDQVVSDQVGPWLNKLDSDHVVLPQAAHAPISITSNIILTFLIQNALYTNKKRLNPCNVPDNIHPESVLEDGKSHKAFESSSS
ncbi:hypothetical protein PSHT_10443, partial [Puccinia striiformis]